MYIDWVVHMWEEKEREPVERRNIFYSLWTAHRTIVMDCSMDYLHSVSASWYTIFKLLWTTLLQHCGCLPQAMVLSSNSMKSTETNSYMDIFVHHNTWIISSQVDFSLIPSICRASCSVMALLARLIPFIASWAAPFLFASTRKIRNN